MNHVRQWTPRLIPAELRERYLAEGRWTNDTLGGLVERCLGGSPATKIGVWSTVRPWHGTYDDVHIEARRLLTVLTEAGLEPGDVVAFQLPNWREAIVSFYALALGGFVMVPIVHIYGPKEVRFILAQSGARAYISADRFGHVDFVEIVDGAGGASDDLPELTFHVVAGDAEGIVAGDAEGQPPVGIGRVGWSAVDAAAPAATLPRPNPDDVCVLAYTSGTTSDPKGVMHTHRTLLAELAHMRLFATEGQALLNGSPVAHATGMLGSVLTPILTGDEIHLIDRWDPTRVLEIMTEAGIGAGAGASFFLASLIDHPDFTPGHAALMGRIGLGGAPVPVALAERAASHGISIIRAYGSTEHPSITGSQFSDAVDKRHCTDGLALPGVEMRLLDEDGAAAVAVGSPGEIWSRGPELCVGYTSAELTAKMFTADGWYRTGDMGVLDADGYITITDRLSDVIIRGGENLSAAEIEEGIAAMPQVAEVAVVAAPDPRMGEHACAVVRLVPGAEPITLADVAAQLGAVGLARQKWPEELRIVDDFPRTGSGKIRKVDLRQQLRDEVSSGQG